MATMRNSEAIRRRIEAIDTTANIDPNLELRALVGANGLTHTDLPLFLDYEGRQVEDMRIVGRLPYNVDGITSYGPWGACALHARGLCRLAERRDRATCWQQLR